MGNKNSTKKLQKRHGVTKSEIKELQTMYRESCGQNKFLSKEEFRKVYNKLFPGDANEFADHMFRKFDTDHNGTVDMREFVIGLIISDSNNLDEKIKFAFDLYDVDGNGAISRDEVVQISRAYAKMHNDETSYKDMAARLFSYMDKNNDEEISYTEFTEAAKNNPDVLNILFPNPSE